jgi:hypothetical protein
MLMFCWFVKSAAKVQKIVGVKEVKGVKRS